MSERIPHEIFVQLQAGEKYAWDWFTRQYGQLLLNTACSYGCNHADAEDIVQEEISKLWEKIHSMKYLKIAWVLRRIHWRGLAFCRNRLLKVVSFDELGGKNEEGTPQPYDPEDPKQPDINDMIDKQINSEAINEAMDCLSEKQRRVIKLKCFEDLSLDEIVVVTGDKKGTVKKQLYCAKIKLREYYFREGPF